MTRLALLAALLVALASPGVAGAAVTWTARADLFRLSYSVPGGAGLAEAGATYVTADGAVHRLGALLATSGTPGQRQTFTVATDEPGRTAAVTVAATPTGADVTVALQPAGGLGEVRDAFAAGPDEHFLGSGERARYVDLRGQAPSLAVSVGCVMAPAPFYWSTAGYGLFVPGTTKGRFAFPAAPVQRSDCGPAADLGGCAIAPAAGLTQVCMQSSSLSYRLYFGTAAAVVAAYTADAGRTAAPDPSLFSLIQWRDVVAGAGDVLADVDRLQAAGVPLGWVLVDNPWEPEQCVGNLVFDQGRFGDPRALISAVHARGVRFMLWVSPMVTCPSSYPQAFMTGNPTTGAYTVVDFDNPAATAFFEERLRGALALGVDGVKGDRGDEIDLGGRQNRYPVQFERAVTDVLAERGKGLGAIFRAGWTGAQAVRGLWAGDQPGDFDGLRQAIRMAASAGVSGYPIWGSDTGGYQSLGLSAETFVRWAQLSAVSPIFEVGGRGWNGTPWLFGDETMALFRAAAVLHYELFPYLYGLAQAAAATGSPVLRPLAFDFPQDPAAWGSDLELMVGPSLLAAPVTDPGATPLVYLPAGGWVDLYGGFAVVGPASFVRPTPLWQFPLYLRRGAAIRFDFRQPALWPEDWGVNDLGRPGRAGWLYAPKPGSAAAPGLAARTSGKTVTLTFTGAERERQVLVVGRRVVGASVRGYATAEELRQAPAGWTTASQPFPGVVVKVGGGRRTVRLTLG